MGGSKISGAGNALRSYAYIVLLLLAALVAGAEIGRAGAQTPALDKLDAVVDQAVALLTRVRQQLIVYDRILQMRVARGALTPEQAAAQLRQRADDLAEGAGTAAAQENEQQEGDLFFATIEKAANTPHWPALQSPAYYKALVGVILDRARADYARRLAAHQDPSQALDDAYRALALTRGQEHLETTPFSDPDSRVFAAMDFPNPPAMPPVTAPPSRLEFRVNRPGQDIKILDVESGDPLECERACKENAECRAFTFSLATSGKARCGLKNGVPAAHADPCCVSEVMAGAPNPPPPAPPPPKSAAMAMQAGVDRPGLDYRDFVLSGPDPEQCVRACEQEERCRAFTYVKPGAQGQLAHCWLKAAIPQPHSNTCCASGTKGASEPGAVKALFEKHNLIGTFAWNCDRPAGVDNQYFVNKLQDPDHVMREHSFGPGKATIKTVIDGIAELGPNEITVSGTTGAQPVQGVWRVEPKRMQQLDSIYNGRCLISDGKDVGTGRPMPWLNRCGP
jgi:hypothetical protein